MRAAALLLVLAASALAPLAEGAEAPPDFRVVLAPGAAPSLTGANVTAEVVNATPTQVEWRLSAAGRERLFGTVVSQGWFRVDRAMQVVPESIAAGVPDEGWHFFTVVAEPHDPARAAWARVANATQAGGNVTLRLALPLNGTTGNATLRLTRDTEPPRFTVGEPTGLTHYGFLLVTRTEEHAIGDLRIRRAGAEGWIPNPTPQLALEQRFPVQGLDPDTEYVYDIEFRDWAGNAARTGERTLRTPPRPTVPGPNITALAPAPNATLDAPVRLIEARLDPDVAPGGVSVFVDARSVQGWTLEGGLFRYEPKPELGPGFHRVTLEARNAAGGESSARWSFTVAPAARPTPDLAAAALLALAAATFLADNRRR